ncbi:MAG TPA: hypothetical protein VNM48_11575, partial [Chloroflexota bacterium]|nr:hypothetical protein [Chloroflexota bacterium]
METTKPAGSGASATSDANASAKTTGNGAARSAGAGTTGAAVTVQAPAPPLPPGAPLRSGALPQTFYNPTRIVWGEGCAAQVGPHAA